MAKDNMNKDETSYSNGNNASPQTPSSSSSSPPTNAINQKKYPRPSWFKVWIHASRPHTLTASIAPVLVGHALTLSSLPNNNNNNSKNITSLSLSWAIFACLIQLSTNLHNDYADFIKGADNDNRIGQPRATQKGWLTPTQTAQACTFCLCLALAVGYPLCMLPSSFDDGGGGTVDWFWVFVVLSSAFNAVAYTGGPYPLGYIGLGSVSIGYSGLGDLFVFLYFGIVATIGVPYLALRHLQFKEEETVMELFCQEEMLWGALLASVPVGFLATAIIVVNNLRDRSTDVLAGKRTMAVRFGETFARLEYGFLVLGSYVSLFWACFFYFTEDVYATSRYWILLPCLSFPMAIPQLKAVAGRGKDGAALNEHVGGTAKVQFLFCILFSVGIGMVYGDNVENVTIS